jgi:hypothetical protein
MSHLKHEVSSPLEPLPADLADVAEMDALLQVNAKAQRAAMPAEAVDRIAAVSTPMLRDSSEPQLKLHHAQERTDEEQLAKAGAAVRGKRAGSHRRFMWAGLAMAACCAIAVLIIVPGGRTQPAGELAGAIDPVAEMDLLIAAVDAMDQQAMLPALGGDDAGSFEGLSDEDLLPLVEIGGSL